MGAGWALAGVAAAGFTFAATPLVRRLAVACGFVDPPAAGKSHARPVPCLGGLAIAGGVLAGVAAGPGQDPRAGAVALGASVLVALGLVDDHRGLRPGAKLLVQVAVALATVAVGVRAGVTGVAALDSAITVLWLVGLTNALNLLDNMDGLAAGAAGATAAAACALAVFGGDTPVATLGAALSGACAGFLFYNAGNATIFMGDTGSLFVGYLLGVVVLQVDPALPSPWSLAVPLGLVALPVADTTVVTLARLRHGRKVSRGGCDHLSHRLVALGAPKGLAVAALVAAQGAVAALAVLAGRALMALPVAAALAGLLLGAVVAPALRARVYDDAAARPAPAPVGAARVACAAAATVPRPPAGHAEKPLAARSAAHRA